MGMQKFQRKGCGSKRTEPNDIAGVPWESNVAGLTLGEEMRKYKDFMVPCEEENKARSVVRAVVQETITLVYPGATVKRCGSHGMNMESFQQGISLVVEDIAEDLIPAAIEELTTLNASATATGRDVVLSVNGIQAEVHLTPDTKSHHRRLTALLKRELQEHPNAELTAFVLTTILETCKLISSTFTSTTFAVLVLGYAKMVGSAEVPPGEFLKGFMDYIGTSFKAETHMVDLADPRGIVPKAPHVCEGFVILDPVSGVNMVGGAHQSLPIRLRLTMQNCLSHMSVTEADLAKRAPSSVGPRSVLSTVIAYHEYWPRTFKFQRESKRTGSPTVSYSTMQSVVSSDDDSE